MCKTAARARALVVAAVGIAVATLFLLSPAPLLAGCGAVASTEPMRFRLEGDVIVAEGRIGAGAADAFEAVLAALETPPRAVALSSPGGRLGEGLALGRAIRAAGLETRLALPAGDCAPPAPVCASACAWAFLGGTARRLPDSAHLGFHAISPAPDQAPVPPERLSRARAEALDALRAYAREMGASPALPDLAEAVGVEALFLPGPAALRALGIETSPT